jgi:hypothetical protein
MHSNPTNPAFTATIASFAAFGIGGVLVPSAVSSAVLYPYQGLEADIRIRPLH